LFKVILQLPFDIDIYIKKENIMDASNTTILSSELQELYLLNKEWFSDVLFLEDETRFYKKIFTKLLLSKIKEEHFHEVQSVNQSLLALEKRREDLKALIVRHQHLLETLIKDPAKEMSIKFIDENTQIVEEIKSVFDSDKTIKKELFKLVEGVIQEDKASHLLE
jgi:hypothetical protein